jgi:hypothetical protein
LLRDHLDLLDHLFDDPGLVKLTNRNPEHPAVSRYRAVANYIGSGGRLDAQAATSDELATALLDISTWAWDGWAGAHIPNEKIKRLRSSDPEQFGDAMAELFYFGFLEMGGFSARLVEERALPDIAVAACAGATTWIEVKRLRPGAVPKRVSKVLNHASNQIKAADPSSGGVAFVSIAPIVPRDLPGDHEPPELSPIFNEVGRVLDGEHCRSVHTAVVAWDEMLAFPEPDGRTLYALQRRSTLLRHRAPRGTLPWNGEALKVERTIEFRVRHLGHRPTR